MKPITFVPAEDYHAGDLAALCDIASHGINARMWQRAIDDGQSTSLFEVGRQCMLVPNHDLSLKHATVAVAGNTVIGAVLGLVRPAGFGQELDLDMAGSEYRGVVELQPLTRGSWHLSVLAVFREYRGLGFGGALMKEAIKRARASKQRKMTLIVARSNSSAVKLYEKFGFKIATQRQGAAETSGCGAQNGSVDRELGGTETWLLMRRVLRP